MELRYYQHEAINACYAWMQANDGNPAIVIPTGGGKTPVIAALCNDAATKWSGRTIVLAHVKELLEQSADSIGRMFPNLHCGVYSAGLGHRDTRPPVVVAGIQSVYAKAREFGHRDLIIVDEAHLIPPSGYGRYRTFIDDMRAINPAVRIIGLTATPYRTTTGNLCGPDELLNEVCYEISVKQLIEDGFLCRLTNKCGQQVDTSGLHIRAGEFIEAEAEALMMSIVGRACEKIVARTADRKSVLVFCCGVKHAETTAEFLRSLQPGRVELVTGESLDFERADSIAGFRAGQVKYLVNVNVLTTGFDAPNVDAVCLLRPTVSPGLYYQMVGRGFRLCDGKDSCLVLDFGDNVRRHGPVDQVRPKQPGRRVGGEQVPPQKICPECDTYLPLTATECPECGYLFDVSRGPKHGTEPGDAPILSQPAIRTDWAVKDVRYRIHRKKDWQSGDPETVRVSYRIGLNNYAEEWLCPEHSGYARMKFESWWRARSNDRIPISATEALELLDAGAVAPTLEVTVEEKVGERFPRIVKYKIGPKPEIEHDPNAEEDFEFPVAEAAGTDDDWTQEAPW